MRCEASKHTEAQDVHKLKLEILDTCMMLLGGKE
jgi:hypothetical protein